MSRAAPWEALTVPYLLERGGLDPDKPAIVFAGETRTYGELRERARRVAHALVGLGIEPGDRVAVLSRNRPEIIEAEVGIAGAGAIMVALNWRLSPGELRNLLQRSRARAVFVEAELRPLVAKLRAAGELPELRTEIVVVGAGGDYEERLAASSPGPLPHHGQMSEIHEIMYTSGTTGEPKGVTWSHGSVIWNSLQQIADFQLGPDCSTYTTIDMHWIGGRHNFTWPILHQGGTVHLKPSSGWDPAEIAAYVASNRITHVLWVPTMIYDILRLEGLGELDFGALRAIMCGGAPVSAEVTAAAQRAFPGADFRQVYGLTEGGSNVTIVPAAQARSKPGSAGKPTMHNEVRIAGVGDGEPAGEIQVRGPVVTPGYWEAPEKTAELLTGEWLRTGDLGYFDEDGFLYVTGRAKELIISGGMNIFPAEIEEVIRDHDSVADVAVVGLPDERWGESVCAAVIPAGGEAIDAAALVELCRDRLASYKKPTRVVAVAEFPRTPSGKVQKAVLAERIGADLGG